LIGAASFTISKRVNSQSAKDVTEATTSLLKPYTLLTITADTSKEFAYHEKMTEALGAPSILLIRTVLGNVG
jgi:IS30 family transposase